jgi:squalene-associated FAD-dependent desaturase
MAAPRIAVVGAGWAGLAAAVRAVQAGAEVTVLEMAARPGGRARALPGDAGSTGSTGSTGSSADGGNNGDTGATPLDNGQHILIGAYTRTLALMRDVGADPAALLRRSPLRLRYPDGRGLSLPPGPAVPAFVRGVLAAPGWSPADRLALLAAASGWALRGFRCDAALTVAALCAGLPPRVRRDLIDPLCVAALNTPAGQASARVLLRVLRDALFSGPGAADLLLPRRPLDALLPAPAWAWLAAQGAQLRAGTRAQALAANGAGRWQVDGHGFDAVVLACTAAEAARLAAGVAPAWAGLAAALRYEPIVTVLLRWPGATLAEPMMALDEGPDAPAQFAFDHGALLGEPGRLAFVVSGARPWVEAGLAATGQAVLRQAMAAAGLFARQGTGPAPAVERVLAEKRATFCCTPSLQRPPAAIATGLWAAGDYVDGPYPATLEGAVRAGEAAAAGALGRPAAR